MQDESQDQWKWLCWRGAQAEGPCTLNEDLNEIFSACARVPLQ